MVFRLYPQLIPHICICDGFGPPRSITFASPWPWIAHPVSCLLPATYHEGHERPGNPRKIQKAFASFVSFRAFRGYALFGLAFATAPPVSSLTWPQRSNSLAHYPKGTRSGGLSHRPPTACRHTVSGSISLPSAGVLFTFPSRYLSTIGHQKYLALDSGLPCFPQD